MSCPHGAGDAGACSQCIGAKPRNVSRDDNGKLVVDGVVVERKFQPPSGGGRPRGRPKRQPQPDRTMDDAPGSDTSED